ncbi:hypothetical protein GW17_00050592, partial [Ensete ventricosum]
LQSFGVYCDVIEGVDYPRLKDLIWLSFMRKTSLFTMVNHNVLTAKGFDCSSISGWFSSREHSVPFSLALPFPLFGEEFYEPSCITLTLSKNTTHAYLLPTASCSLPSAVGFGTENLSQLYICR